MSQTRAYDSVDSLPPHCPEAERGVLGCCLLNADKVEIAVKAGVTRQSFYDLRHKELFQVLTTLAAKGCVDPLMTTIALRERGKLETVGGMVYLIELQNSVPSAENLEYYIPDLLDYSRRRMVLEAATRLKVLAQDPTADSAAVLADTTNVLEVIRRRADPGALPDRICAADLAVMEIAKPPELVDGIIHQGSKFMVGGASKSFKTWNLIDLALSVSTGTPWMGFPTTAAKVLYINLEIQTAFFRSRLWDVARAKGSDLADNRNLDVWNLRGYLTDYRTLIPKIREDIRHDGHALVIVDPTYKILGQADENSATDVAALLNSMESIAVTTGAAVAMAAHYAKGNAAAKESIDRISGSGVFARDPDSVLTFTRHEEEGAFTVEPTLRNLAPVAPFVVRWEFPLFVRAEGLDPAKLKQSGGRPTSCTPEQVLGVLGDERLDNTQWQERCETQLGISRASYFKLRKQLETEEKVHQSALDKKWERIQAPSKNYQTYKD